MRSTLGFLAALATATATALSCSPVGAATIGGTHYAPQYDFQDFWTAADGKYFRVVLAGNPFPVLPPEPAAAGLLPVMQAAKPRPAPTFTCDAARDQPRRDYRLLLVSNAAGDLNGDAVCKGTFRSKPGLAGGVNLLRRLLLRRHGDVDDDGHDAE